MPSLRFLDVTHTPCMGTDDLLEGSAGPAVFVPAAFEVPDMDRKTYDAHALSLHEERQKQVS